MPSKNDEKKAQEQSDKALKEGTYLALENDDNALAVSNPEYIGVDPIYQNSADELNLPQPTSAKDDPVAADIEERAKAYQEAYTNLDVNRDGYTPGPHRAGLGVKLEDVQEKAGYELEEGGEDADSDAYKVAAEEAREAAEAEAAKNQGS